MSEKFLQRALFFLGAPAVVAFVYCLVAIAVSKTYWECVDSVHSPHVYTMPYKYKEDGAKKEYVPDTNIREYKP